MNDAPTIQLEDGSIIEAEAGTVDRQWRVFSADMTRVYHHVAEAEDGTWLYRLEEVMRPPTMADPFA